MKTLENKPTTIKIPGKEDGSVDYASLIQICLDHVPEVVGADGVPRGIGFSRCELKSRDRIEKVVEDSNGKFEFEDADAENLKRIVNQNMRWGARHKDVLRFCDDVEAL